ncbi:DMT family transporter [Nocardia africana]|uniref:DMT family transporter n=1 Tax=Nocardia africana TaxID=134964 RepID=A0ABW6NRC3_9NOCA
MVRTPRSGEAEHDIEPGSLDTAARRPAMAAAGMAAGALAVSSSSVFIALSHARPEVSTFYRCALAMPVLVAVAWREGRRGGWLTLPDWWVALACGAFFAADMVWWGAAILEVGAGLSTVLVNVQVIVVPMIAYLVDREKPGRIMIFALPLMMCGVAAAGGVLEHHTAGSATLRGAAHAIAAGVCYSGFLFLLRRAGLRGRTRQTYTVAVGVAALVAAGVLGFRMSIAVLAVDRPALGWLLATAVSGQVIGWLLVALCAPRLSSASGAALLLLTPVGSLALSAIVLHEHPSLIQITGCVLILGCAYAVAKQS